MWIAGADVAGDGAVEVVRNPATEEPLAEVRSASVWINDPPKGPGPSAA